MTRRKLYEFDELDGVWFEPRRKVSRDGFIGRAATPESSHKKKERKRGKKEIKRKKIGEMTDRIRKNFM